jgi:hypothetical protein
VVLAVLRGSRHLMSNTGSWLVAVVVDRSETMMPRLVGAVLVAD